MPKTLSKLRVPKAITAGATIRSRSVYTGGGYEEFVALEGKAPLLDFKEAIALQCWLDDWTSEMQRQADIQQFRADALQAKEEEAACAKGK